MVHRNPILNFWVHYGFLVFFRWSVALLCCGISLWTGGGQRRVMERLVEAVGGFGGEEEKIGLLCCWSKMGSVLLVRARV